ncbi:hypothetical protein M493_10480 [Geobacillus genomosp. 3]|uniref:Uncharacterized protein n=1 Tax=Geobacillus genomosp. 3 TaxID=1921421 RepID=S5Z671_GEOG3|nr:hypothetical protein M493_10480 [Geobacillus genomosp. 3]
MARTNDQSPDMFKGREQPKIRSRRRKVGFAAKRKIFLFKLKEGEAVHI